MAKKDDKDFIKWKFKDLLVYGSTEWLADGKKKYQQVFEAEETTYLYAELSFYNKLFDEENWDVNVTLKCFEVNEDGSNGKELCSIPKPTHVKMEDNVIYIREGWGNSNPGGFWKKGKFRWEAVLDDESIGTCEFYVEDGGQTNEIQNNYFSFQAVKLFEGPNSLLPEEEREYYSEFNGTETRFIWAELILNNLRQDTDWALEVTFNFYNDARQLKGRTTELVTVKKDQDDVMLCSGWGSDHKGTWYNDNYTLEIVFMEQLIAVVPFVVGEDFFEGEFQVFESMVGSGKPKVGGKQMDVQSLEEVLQDLEALIGLTEIKKKVRDYTQYLNFLKIREEKGFEDAKKINLHAVFTGNPGTGKTTVGKLLGKIYNKMGLLSKGHVHEVDRSDIVGEYIGQTAPKVKEAIKKAKGGILFIDEAYSLARGKEDSKDYGREVIEILIKEMSDGTGDMAVLVAGYPAQMQTFLDSNPGLKSRFNLHFQFPDFVPQELMEIANYSLVKRNVSLTDDAREFLYEKLVEAYRNRDNSFGNARYVNSLIDEAKMNMGLRLMTVDNVNELTEEELSTVNLADIEKIFGVSSRLAADIPIDEDLLTESMGELNALTGLNSVKNEIHELVKLVRFYRDIGKDVMNSFSLHTIFSGNPGTGKTTVARILAKIYKALGILEKGHIVEVDRQRLVAGYIGQTATKTAALIEESKGGVLFIDEAYALTQGGGNDYGKEAVETLLKRMEDQRGEFIVIAAGYPDNMNQFLESNPGLKSRFDKHLQFEDYSADELMEIAENMYAGEGLKLERGAKKYLQAYFEFLVEHKDKFFGNARSVRKVYEESVKNQHLRLASIDKEKRTEDMLQTVTIPDVEEFSPDKDKLVTSRSSAIGFGLPNDQGGANPGALDDDAVDDNHPAGLP